MSYIKTATLFYDDSPNMPNDLRCTVVNEHSGIVGMGATYEDALRDMRDRTPHMLTPETPPVDDSATYRPNFQTNG